RSKRDWSSDVCSSDLGGALEPPGWTWSFIFRQVAGRWDARACAGYGVKWLQGRWDNWGEAPRSATSAPSWGPTAPLNFTDRGNRGDQCSFVAEPGRRRLRGICGW